jgi:hypothetical protein
MVRYLIYDDDNQISPRLALELALSRPAKLPCLLPNLQSLEWTHLSTFTPLLPLLIPPNLSELYLQHDAFDQAETSWYHSTVTCVLPLCRGLQSLTIDFFNWGVPDESMECRDAEQALLDFLSQAPLIENFRFDADVYLSSSTIHQLSLLPRLTSLHVSCSRSILISFEQPLVQRRFLTLSRLSLSTPLSMAMEFAQFHCSLSSFEILCRSGSVADLKKWLMNSYACYGCELRDLKIHVEIYESWDGSGLANFVSGIKIIRLTLKILPGIDFSDEIFENLGSALPFLREFECLDTTHANLTVWGILRFLAHCPEMVSLDIQFIAIVVENDVRSHNLPRSNLAQLSVSSSPIDDAVLVAELFGELLPCLQSISHDGAEGDEDSAESINGAKWSQVWKLQEAFQRIRNQARSEGIGEIGGLVRCLLLSFLSVISPECYSYDSQSYRARDEQAPTV